MSKFRFLCTIDLPKCFFMKKCYSPFNLKATFWCGSCWKILKWYVIQIPLGLSRFRTSCWEAFEVIWSCALALYFMLVHLPPDVHLFTVSLLEHFGYYHCPVRCCSRLWKHHVSKNSGIVFYDFFTYWIDDKNNFFTHYYCQKPKYWYQKCSFFVIPLI